MINQIDQAELEIIIGYEISFMDDSISYNELANEILINSSTPELGFGLGRKTWDDVKTECRLLFCEKHPKYQDVIDKMEKLSKHNSTILVSIVSGAIGAFIGAVGALVAPLVALILLAISRIGKEVICKNGKLDVPIK